MRKAMMGLAFAVAGVGAMASGPAEASCFYNKSEIENIRVQLDCGWFCSNDWTIRKGDYNCRGGKGGDFDVGLPKANGYLSTWVEDRGYVVIEGSCSGVTVKVFREDHNMKHMTASNLRWVGQGC